MAQSDREPSLPRSKGSQSETAAPAARPRDTRKLGAIEHPGGVVDLTGGIDKLPDQDLRAWEQRRRWLEERARFHLAASFVVIFAGTVIWACWASVAASKEVWGQAKELLQSLLPVQTTLLGGAVAFYFATREDKKQ